MKRKKILYIGNALSHKGATVTSVETLGVFLRNEGYEVIVSSSVQNKILRMLDMIRAVISLKSQTKTVLIDTYSTTNFWYAIIIGYWCRLFKLDYIPILRGGNLPYRLKNNPKRCKRFFGNAHYNIVPSQYLLHDFKDAGYINLKYIPNTIETTKYPYIERSTLKPNLLWVRSFAGLYNPIMAIKVLQELQKEYPEAKLTMVGPRKDSSFDECKLFAKEHNLPVTFTGKLSKQEWIALGKSHDIFISTTNFDNTPISVIEAMALGLPVVSTNVGGMPFLINDQMDGILTPEKDVIAFTSKLSTLLKTPTLVHTISKNGRVKAESFDWNQVKTLWKNVLD
ncbi:glycosyltransferase family 4 protein [uncultured Dokdonia sp.]|uniref:glycosyltransferase family 4 protein n=1 Tax=uncultured Dokdonia sp. TaxID=575653 RepID=UPI0026328AC2|nr:glycosyltransferase family 4 protein [uncultured Dokdonia sp.]